MGGQPSSSYYNPQYNGSSGGTSLLKCGNKSYSAIGGSGGGGYKSGVAAYDGSGGSTTLGSYGSGGRAIKDISWWGQYSESGKSGACWINIINY